MRIRVEFELTPKEFRDSLGLPDVSALQDKAIGALQKRLESDIKNFDATKLFNAWVSQGLETSVHLQRMLSKAVGSAFGGRGGEAEEEPKPSQPAAKKKPRS